MYQEHMSCRRHMLLTVCRVIHIIIYHRLTIAIVQYENDSNVSTLYSVSGVAGHK